MYFKSKLNVWGALLTFLTLIIILHLFNLNFIGQEVLHEYLDAKELTNYTLLESLISGKICKRESTIFFLKWFCYQVIRIQVLALK